MRRFWILSLIFVTISSFGSEEGVGILFDNSGSMRTHFTNEMIQDAKDAVLDFVITGTYDQSIWNLEAESDQYKTRTNKKIWNPGNIIYVHAFGELRSRTEPFFVSRPNYAELNSVPVAKQFIRNELYRNLNFSDDFTNFDLAKYLCWWNLCAQLGSGGKNYYMNVLIVSDFLVDIQEDYSGAGSEIQNAFITNNSGETTLLRLVHKIPSRKDSNIKLEMRIIRIGPHFIQEVTSPPEQKDAIKLQEPAANFEIDTEKHTNIRFSWDTQGSFENYIFEVHSVNPRRKVLTRETTQKQMIIPARILISQMNAIDSSRLVWFVKGVYPEEGASAKASITSNRHFISLFKEDRNKIWILFFVLLLIAAIIFGLTRGIRMYQRRKRGQKDKKNRKEGSQKKDDDEDWDKDL